MVDQAAPAAPPAVTPPTPPSSEKRGLPRHPVSDILPPCGGNRPRASMGRKRIEIVSTGIDEALQGHGGDPFGGTSWTGLRVPAFVNSPSTRYLFQLATFSVPDKMRARIVGFRQGWTLGLQQQSSRIIEQWVDDPFFKLPDGGISWHLRRMAIDYPRPTGTPGPFDPAANFPGPLASFKFETSSSSALLYQLATFPAVSGFYTTLSSYIPPNRGMPWGEPVAADLGTFYDLKSKWRDDDAWAALDIPIDGPSRVALYASVLQTNPNSQSGRTVVTPPNPFLFQNGLSPEEQFLLNFPTAIIWRVAGALAVELEDEES